MSPNLFTNSAGPPSKRIFFGIPIEEELSPKFFSWAKRLPAESALEKLDIRWTKPENFHITLCFLGDSPHHPVERLVDHFRQNSWPAFWLQIEQLGFFEPKRNSALIWAGVTSKEIFELHQWMWSELCKFGYQKDFKPFKPHITLGRMKHPIPNIQDQVITTDLDQFKVQSFCLYESILALGDTRYKKLETFDCK